MGFAGWGTRTLERSAKPWPSGVAADQPVVIFDGVCNFCNGSIQFLLKRERSPRLRFAAAQSEIGGALLNVYGRDVAALDSIMLVDATGAFEKSDAILRIVPNLRWNWQWLRLGWLLPRFFRDWLYDVVAKRRYRWFGKREECMLPSKELRARFY